MKVNIWIDNCQSKRRGPFEGRNNEEEEEDKEEDIEKEEE